MLKKLEDNLETLARTLHGVLYPAQPDFHERLQAFSEAQYRRLGPMVNLETTPEA